MSPAQLIIGGGTANDELGDVVLGLGMKRPLLVTDPFMCKSGKAQEVIDGLAPFGIKDVTIFSDTTPEPTTVDVMKGVEAFNSGGHDGLIALGGGSPIDIAKVIRILSSNHGTVRDYKVPNPIPNAGPPMVAVPTTAGTGSEVTKAAVISDVETQEKMLLMSHHMVPSAAVVDYQLTMSCPARLAYDNAIDALTHAIEAYVSVKATPVSDMYALKAMKDIPPHIRRVRQDPNDETSREALMLAATQAGLAFSNASVALVHGMSRPLGVHFHVPHGLSNAMLLPTITEFSIPACPDRYAECARHIGCAKKSDDDETACRLLIKELKSLNDELKVPSPRDFGIEEAKYMEIRELMAEQALASGSPGNNPRTPSKDEIVELYGLVYAQACAHA